MGKPVVIHAIRGYLSRTETFVGNQVTSLQHHKPIVVCHHRSPNREFDIEDMFVMREYESGIRNALGWFAYRLIRSLTPNEVNAASSWIGTFRPALFHFHFAVDAAFFLPLYRKLRIPAIVSMYGYDISSFPKTKRGYGRVYLKRAFDSMDCFLAMSSDMKQDAIELGIPAEKILVHYHGINAQRFCWNGRTYEGGGPFNILCVGTLEPKKGQHHLLRSLVELRKIRPDINAKVTLVGKGPLGGDLENMVNEFGLRDRVDLAGFIPHLDPRLLAYYRDADVFVHFSTRQPNGDKEGIPGTIVEAMASGLPVIATHHAGIPEVIVDGTHGILLEEHDVAGIVRSLITLYENPDLRRKIGLSAARRALEELDIRTKTLELERIYDTIIRQQKGPTVERGANNYSTALGPE